MNRRSLYISIVLVVVAAVMMGAALAGCGEEATGADMDGAAPAAPDQVSSTSAPESDASDATDIPPTVAGQYVDLTPEQAKQLIDSMSDVVIIDVSPYYDDGHLPGALHYYGGDGSLDAAIPTLDMEATYLVYCHADGPAIAGAQALVDAGFEKVYRLEGNYSAWVDAGYPVEM